MPRLYRQHALFDVQPAAPDPRHRWLWRPFGPSECADCQLLWFPGATREEIGVFLTETCPVRALDSPSRPFAYIYL